MVMIDTLLAARASSSDRAWLKQCRDHNARLGRQNGVEAAERRLRDLDLHDALRVRPEAHSVEERVSSPGINRSSKYVTSVRRTNQNMARASDWL